MKGRYETSRIDSVHIKDAPSYIFSNKELNESERNALQSVR